MTTMRALVIERYGPPEDVLRLEQVPRPQPKQDEVLVRVHATALNSWDWDSVTGTPMGRITGPFKPPFKILGADVAGTVETVGPGVTSLKRGDRVFGDLSGGKWGGFADYVCAPASVLALIPPSLSFVDSAAVPQAGSLVLQALRKFPQLGAGHIVVFNGAGGGVGTFGIQLAKATGATIIAVDRAEKREALLALGADGFIDYQSEDFTATAERYDLIIDVVANRPASHYRRCLRRGGRLVVIGGTISSLLRILVASPFSRGKTLSILPYRISPSDNLTLAATVRPVVDSTFALEDGAKALRRLGGGRAVGKVVITVE
ncbi:NAD(P)-dependent alcohol dehydrogenase [Devosia sp. PTR5]|uniref:NAD(P)-dependent alcohol dehydrogenase n=1 Tax=Devosia oryzisoli TaxID=2774138 RepID=A0A927FQY7_9HYPH|nr:NAD(P)-dependent alcohol dehydrogenase [Devosia oryzisoli]MBD8064625.1 NAD(P)-dependent alcohol dehydrogenase [Devosia oryzisoli]